MEALLLIVGFFLLVVSIIDWKIKQVPSIFLTGMLFVVASLNPANLWFGVLGFIMSYLMLESGFFSGVADLKVMTMLSFLISTSTSLFLFIILTLVFGIVWKVLIKWKFKRIKTCAFLPVFCFVYIALYILGGIF